MELPQLSDTEFSQVQTLIALQAAEESGAVAGRALTAREQEIGEGTEGEDVEGDPVRAG